uniref:Uncharacterized protein n=1 Tax=Parascaris univalens TaxID=6257 RepID=A0A915C5D3_PARUN
VLCCKDFPSLLKCAHSIRSLFIQMYNLMRSVQLHVYPIYGVTGSELSPLYKNISALLSGPEDVSVESTVVEIFLCVSRFFNLCLLPSRTESLTALRRLQMKMCIPFFSVVTKINVSLCASGEAQMRIF